MLYKDLPRKYKRLYKIAYENGLTEWYFTAARILEQVNGMECAENYLMKCGKSSPQEEEDN